MVERKKLLNWYKKNYRKLPWRESEDPYKIWISEIMCQQTRVAAVIPYYKNFLKHFPDVHSLAKAKEEEVLELWTGLGYYSRARNIHKAAKLFSKTGFPSTYLDLKSYPGLGDYTSRAISSFAYKEKVGVLDGNVIRFLSRFYGACEESWTSSGKMHLQEMADHWAQEQPELVNQALMEIGANLCLPKNPHCSICPLSESCIAKDRQITDYLPLKRSKKQEEIWKLSIYLFEKEGKIALTKDHDLPVLKSQFFPPCVSEKLLKEPSTPPQLKHAVTHHRFYVYACYIDQKGPKMRDYSKQEQDLLEGAIWVKKVDLKKYCQSSLVQKLLLP